LNYHIGRVVLGSMCVGVSVWLGWSGIRVAGYWPFFLFYLWLKGGTQKVLGRIVLKQYCALYLSADTGTT